jgi:uncharacterized protein GlcG (DUF336 family)
MPINIVSISYAEAAEIVTRIIGRAASDGGKPVAVAVVDAVARVISFAAMDGVTPACTKLSQSKAYSAVLGQQDTRFWASKLKDPSTVDFDMRNWTDCNFTGFTGGITIRIGNAIIGGIGVSGRNGVMSSADVVMQDSELATFGRDPVTGLKG